MTHTCNRILRLVVLYRELYSGNVTEQSWWPSRCSVIVAKCKYGTQSLNYSRIKNTRLTKEASNTRPRNTQAWKFEAGRVQLCTAMKSFLASWRRTYTNLFDELSTIFSEYFDREECACMYLSRRFGNFHVRDPLKSSQMIFWDLSVFRS